MVGFDALLLDHIKPVLVCHRIPLLQFQIGLAGMRAPVCAGPTAVLKMVPSFCRPTG
jgi:hypothetical protein